MIIRFKHDWQWRNFWQWTLNLITFDLMSSICGEFIHFTFCLFIHSTSIFCISEFILKLVILPLLSISQSIPRFGFFLLFLISFLWKYWGIKWTTELEVPGVWFRSCIESYDFLWFWKLCINLFFKKFMY